MDLWDLRSLMDRGEDVCRFRRHCRIQKPASLTMTRDIAANVGNTPHDGNPQANHDT